MIRMLMLAWASLFLSCAHARQIVWDERPIALDIHTETETQLILPAPVRVRVPARATLEDARGADTLRIVLDIEDAVGSDVRRDRRGPGARVERAKPYFIQMMGTATISGRLNGVPLQGSGTGFFETYR